MEKMSTYIFLFFLNAIFYVIARTVLPSILSRMLITPVVGSVVFQLFVYFVAGQSGALWVIALGVGWIVGLLLCSVFAIVEKRWFRRSVDR
jgi:predicted outer membrane lipoprotein